MTVDAAGSDVVGDEARLYGDGDGNDRREQQRAQNVLSGTTQGHVVQTGVVQGDVHFHSAGAPATIAPRQLPPSPLKFVGRTAELARLDGWLDSTRGRSVLVALGGSGGVGKTALGVSWLRQHAARFTDGELYIDLGGSDSSEPMAPSEALGRLLRALGISSEQLPAGLDERAALYRSVTAGKALALLLDNVVSAAQVRLLLPSSESAVVVVTSRVRLVGLALEGAQFLDLNPLSTEDAVGLLSALLGRDRVDEELSNAWVLSRLCSGFPLALAVVSARLLAHPQWTIARIVEQLKDQRRRLAALSLEDDISVQAVLDACYRDLSGRASQLYRLLAWCPGDDFPVELVTCVLPDPVDSKEALSELVEANLVQEQIRDRYRYHDLLRVHAAKPMPRKMATRRESTCSAVRSSGIWSARSRRT
jgi:hypothetical protein